MSSSSSRYSESLIVSAGVRGKIGPGPLLDVRPVVERRGGDLRQGRGVARGRRGHGGRRSAGVAARVRTAPGRLRAVQSVSERVRECQTGERHAASGSEAQFRANSNRCDEDREPDQPDPRHHNEEEHRARRLHHPESRSDACISRKDARNSDETRCRLRRGWSQRTVACLTVLSGTKAVNADLLRAVWRRATARPIERDASCARNVVPRRQDTRPSAAGQLAKSPTARGPRSSPCCPSPRPSFA